MEIHWSNNPEIAALLDTITHACTYCGGPARVPEDVAAVIEIAGKRDAFVVCPACSDQFILDMRRRGIPLDT